MEIASPNQVADYLIYFAHQKGDVITNLKLQKLLYYSQAWHLALKDKEIFSENFEAWVHGAVLPSQYQRFREFSYNPISLDIKEPDIPQELKDHLNEIMEIFGGESAYALERMVHCEYPWIEAREGLSPDEPSDNIILKETMKKFYRKMSNEADGKDSKK